MTRSQSYRRGEDREEKVATRRNGVVGNTGSTAPAAESVVTAPPAPMAGLPANKAIVFVGPPLFCKLPR